MKVLSILLIFDYQLIIIEIEKGVELTNFRLSCDRFDMVFLYVSDCDRGCWLTGDDEMKSLRLQLVCYPWSQDGSQRKHQCNH